MTVTATVIIIIVSLSFFAGLIAYVGDILGTVIGKRRLSLFGVRPKQTGRLIGVFAGILIMLMTIAVLAFALRDTTRRFFQVQGLLADLNQQRVEFESVQRQLSLAQRDLLEQQTSLQTLQQESQALQQANQSLVQVNDSLQVLNEDLSQEITEQQSQVDQIQNQALTLQNLVAEQAKELEDARAFAAALESGGVTYTAGQVIHSAIIDANDPVIIQERLNNFITEATDKATLRGAASLTLDLNFIFGALIEDIAATESSDILTLVSPVDQFRQVQGAFESVTNEKIVDKGQLLVSQQIHLGSTDSPVSTDEVRADLARLSDLAKSRLQFLNAVVDLNLDNEGLSTNDFANQLLDRLKGPVTIGVIAVNDIFRAGPAQIELAVIY